MEIIGNLSEFPLPELLQFLGRRCVTGSLSLTIFSNYYAELKPSECIVWLYEGNIVALKRTSCSSDIYDLIVQNEWVNRFTAKRLKDRAPANIPSGMYLETQGIINFGQLRTLFFANVVRPIENLLAIQNSTFKFQTTYELPMHEMIGLNFPAMEVAKRCMQGNELCIGSLHHIPPRKSHCKANS